MEPEAKRVPGVHRLVRGVEFRFEDSGRSTGEIEIYAITKSGRRVSEILSGDAASRMMWMLSKLTQVFNLFPDDPEGEAGIL